MIIEMLLIPIFAIINGFVLLIPTITGTNLSTSTIPNFISMVSRVSYFVPLGLIFTCITTLIIIDSFQFILWFVNFLIKKIPTI